MSTTPKGCLGGVLLAACAVVGLFIFSCAGPGRGPARTPPNFASYAQVRERKAAFFAYLLPFVDEANAETLKERERLLRLRKRLAALELRMDARASKAKANAPAPRAHAKGREARWLRALAEEYALTPPEAQVGLDLHFVDQVLLRVDVVPPSLALAQAANESAWGTSRFAQQGNNFFGLRSTDGSGLVPRHRAAGAVFRVASYASPRDSVRAYIKTLNTRPAYRALRALRAEERRQGREPTGLRLASGLSSYSERGEDYVRDIRSMIQGNGLAQYDGR